MTAIDTLRRLMARWQQSGSTARDLADVLGEIENAGGAHEAMRVKPGDAVFQSAEITPGGGADAAKSVTLTIAPAADVRLSALRDAFGEAQFMPKTRPGQADRVQFWLDEDTGDYTFALFASTREQDRVESILIRRDARIT